jgi:hypothetical protein
MAIGTKKRSAEMSPEELLIDMLEEITGLPGENPKSRRLFLYLLEQAFARETQPRPAPSKAYAKMTPDEIMTEFLDKRGDLKSRLGHDPTPARSGFLAALNAAFARKAKS